MELIPILHPAGAKPVPQAGGALPDRGDAISGFFHVLKRLTAAAGPSSDAVLTTADAAHSDETARPAEDTEEAPRPLSTGVPVAPARGRIADGPIAGPDRATGSEGAGLDASSDVGRSMPVRLSDAPPVKRQDETAEPRIATDPPPAEQEDACRTSPLDAAALSTPQIAPGPSLKPAKPSPGPGVQSDTAPTVRHADWATLSPGLPLRSPEAATAASRQFAAAAPELGSGPPTGRAVPDRSRPVNAAYLLAPAGVNAPDRPVPMPSFPARAGESGAPAASGTGWRADRPVESGPPAPVASAAMVERPPASTTPATIPVQPGAEYGVRATADPEGGAHRIPDTVGSPPAHSRTDAALPGLTDTAAARPADAATPGSRTDAPVSPETKGSEGADPARADSRGDAQQAREQETAEVRRGPAAGGPELQTAPQAPDDSRGGDDLALPAGPDIAPAGRGHDRSGPAGAQIVLPHDATWHLAKAASANPDRPVEVTLSPEELGRVRLAFTTQDGALTMLVQAERPETLELLRRHIDSLAQDFRELGYEDLTFSFGQHGDQRRLAATDDLPLHQQSEEDPHPSDASPPRSGSTAMHRREGGLDLRM